MRTHGIGSIVRTIGDVAIASLPAGRVGDGVSIVSRSRRVIGGRIAAVERGRVAIVPFGSLVGIAVGDRVESTPDALDCVLGFGLLGRAIDPSGRALDGGGTICGTRVRVAPTVSSPAQRQSIDAIAWTGIRAIDGLLAFGRGARIGIFGAPGTGKTSLLEMLAAGRCFDAVVIGLVGERGREAEAWLRRIDRRSTVICATADRSAAERVRSAEVTMAQACSLRERGFHVLLILDSLARYAAALRERASALGEPPGRGGYPASVWSEFGRFLESAGNYAHGSVTLVATVLVDGDEERDPVCVNARAALDGHLTLSPSLARAGRFPAIDVLASTSRTMCAVVDARHRDSAAAVRGGLARLAATEDFRAAGLSDRDDPEFARTAEVERALEAFLRQGDLERPDATRAALHGLAALM